MKVLGRRGRAVLLFVAVLAGYAAPAVAQSTNPYTVVGTAQVPGSSGTEPAVSASVTIYAGDFTRSALPISETAIVATASADDNGRFIIYGLLPKTSSAYTIEAVDATGSFIDRQQLKFPQGPDMTVTVEMDLHRALDSNHAARSVNYARRTVYFATSRGSGTAGRLFDNERSSPWREQVGNAHVELPSTASFCNAPKPPWTCSLRFDNGTPLVSEHASTPRATFLASIANDVRRSSSHRALLFVHGFNVAFSDALVIAGQLALDEKASFDGPAILFSWPSKHDVVLYGPDLNNSEIAANDLRNLIEDIVANIGPGRLDIVAHSMGNRALTNALRSVAMNRTPPTSPPLRHVIMAAADVDALGFAGYAGAIAPLAKQFTLYASSHDQALLASRCFNGGYYRLGTFTDPLPLTPPANMEIVDVSPVRSDFLGHGYFIGSPDVENDVISVLNESAGRTAAAQGTYLRIGTGSPPLLLQQAANLQVHACDGLLNTLKAILDHG